MTEEVWSFQSPQDDLWTNHEFNDVVASSTGTVVTPSRAINRCRPSPQNTGEDDRSHNRAPPTARIARMSLNSSLKDHLRTQLLAPCFALVRLSIAMGPQRTSLLLPFSRIAASRHPHAARPFGPHERIVSVARNRKVNRLSLPFGAKLILRTRDTEGMERSVPGVEGFKRASMRDANSHQPTTTTSIRQICAGLQSLRRPRSSRVSWRLRRPKGLPPPRPCRKETRRDTSLPISWYV